MMYDVIIMGGGPAGSTLGALLSRHTKLKAAIYEKDFFPREHIGESLTPACTVAMARSGALPKVLASDCYVGPKLGAYFAWDPDKDPWIVIFNFLRWQQGTVSFAFHVNRSEFDKILLDHARDVGTDVFEGVGINEIHREQDHTRVILDDGSEVKCRLFVDASGRQTSVTGTRKRFLSSYQNIAIWNHFVGAKPPASPAYDWNVFHDKRQKIPGFYSDAVSPIGNFACDDGWFWYIPVKKKVMGKRVVTHSIGIVTDPEILKKSGKRYTDMETLVAKARTVPILKDLMAEAEPISDKVLTATNYSMISQTLCDYDQKWLLLGDCAFFVDPLFSTGVGNAMMSANAAQFLIQATLESSLPEQSIRDLWYDYQHRYTSVAVTFALGIDQWYHAIARSNPNSDYWKTATDHRKDLRDKTFSDLVNLEVIEQVFYDHTVDRKHWSGFLEAGGLFSQPDIVDQSGRAPGAAAKITLHPDVEMRKSVVLGQLRQKDAPHEFWTDPITNYGLMDGVPSLHDCHRFFFPDRPGDLQVPFKDAMEGGLSLFELLVGGDLTYAELAQKITPEQHRLLGKLQRAGMVLVDGREVLLHSARK